MKKLPMKAQSITEYVIFISLIIAVFTAMQIYVQRSIQGKIKVSADVLGLQKDYEQTDWRKGAMAQDATTTTASLDQEKVTTILTPNSAQDDEDLYIYKDPHKTQSLGHSRSEGITEGF